MKGNERDQWVADLRQRQKNILLEDRVRNIPSLGGDDARPIKTARQLIALILGFLAIVAGLAIFFDLRSRMDSFQTWFLVLSVAVVLAILFFLSRSSSRAHRQREHAQTPKQPKNTRV
jgi:hypothetical protein